MLVPLVTALILVACPQAGSDLRVRAEQLARAGRTVEAIELFKQVVDKDPAYTEARLWIARLDLCLGKTAQAEAGFRAVLAEHPADVDAKIGLGNTLLRKGAVDDALAVLSSAEPEAGQNADLFSALGRAYRRAGDDPHALEYFTRARALAPGDPDVVQGYEALVLAYGHSITFEGFIDSDTTGVKSSYGSLVGSVRVVPRLSLGANARFRRRTGTSDALGGGGFVWRVARATNLSFSALVGDGNTVLPTSDVFGDITHYVGAYEIGGMVRRLSFSGVNVAAFSPVFAWDPGPTRFDVRYTYSQSTFSDSGESTGDHSVFVRETWRRWRRASVNVAYAYGIESFEDLTVDRIGSLGASTLALGARFTAPSLTMIATTWEHQWRSNSTALDRFTVGIVQFFP